MKVRKAWMAALVLSAAGGVAMAGPGCDDKWAEGMHDEVPPKAAKADAKATTAAKDARASTATASRAPARADATKVVQATK